MSTVPRLDAVTAAPEPVGAAAQICWRCDSEPAATECRICRRPLCVECRIDHYHEGWER